MIVKLLTEHHLEFLSSTGGCRGSPESTLVIMSNCWKSHAAAQIIVGKLFVSFEVRENQHKSGTFPSNQRDANSFLTF